MANHKISGKRLCILFFLCLFFVSCTPADIKKTGIKRDVKIPETAREKKAAKLAPEEPKTPDFVPAVEDISPIRTRIVDIAARNTPLRDVLHLIAEAASLNLVVERGVNPELPVTLTLKNVTAEYALNTIFSAVDYFYRIEENLLIVKALDTKMFELGHPAMVQAYAVDVGGDILGGAISTTGGTTGGGGRGGTGGAGGATTSIRGNVSQTIKSDDSAFKFWDTIEKSLGNILGVVEGQRQGSDQQSFNVNRLTGTIHITATKKNLQRVEHYIDTVRKVINRQVIIEAKIVEVTLSDTFQFGIDWTLVSRHVTTIGGTTDTRVSSSYTVGTRRFNAVVSDKGPVFAIEGKPSFGGAQADLNFVLNALEEQGEVRTLSNPKLNIMNGQTALLSVGRNETYISRVETTSTPGVVGPTQTFTVDTSSILSGVLIGILPYINESGEISLTVTPIVSDLVSLTPADIGGLVQISLPKVDLREMSTTVKVKDGDVVVIGGLISQKERLQDDQVPFLGNIPVVGLLFKSRNKLESKTELVVILQPTLISR